jgi:2,4-dienoyl-CoA reductase (NADPH2)
VGQKVAIIGAGGIGFDLVEYLSHPADDEDSTQSAEAFAQDWGIDQSMGARGGVAGVKENPRSSGREIWLLQRSAGKPGAGLGKTTGWVHRLNLKRRSVKSLSGVHYRFIDDAGLHIERDGTRQLLAVDHVVVCAGQLENRGLADELKAMGREVHVIGGAHVAGELDAKRAIREGCELAARL